MEGTFSHHVRDVISLSRDEALRLGNDHIGTGHLLLGLLRLGHGTAIEILDTLGCDLEALKQAAEDKLADQGSDRAPGQVPLTRPAERVLKANYLEASLYQSTVIGTEHLLLSLLRNDDDLSAVLLRDACGITYATVREALSDHLGEAPVVKGEDPIKTTFTRLVSKIVPPKPPSAPPAAADMVPVVVAALNADASGTTYRLVLAEKKGSRRLTLPLGDVEAQAIAMELEGLHATPPRIHALFATVLGHFGISITAVHLSLTTEGTYHCVLLTTSSETTIQETARPADAIVLALRAEAPIYAHTSLFDASNG